MRQNNLSCSDLFFIFFGIVGPFPARGVIVAGYGSQVISAAEMWGGSPKPANPAHGEGDE